MENFLSSFQQIKSSEDEKYDVLYVNTPWNRLSSSQMSKLSIKDLAKENSLLYIWADTYTLADTVALINAYGYNFESVYQVCDIASYPNVAAPKAKAVQKVEAAEKEEKTEEANPEEKTDSMDVVEEKTDDPKKAPVKRTKKPRCPPLNTPRYWTTTNRGSSRSTTEYLLLAFRGDSSILTTLSNEKAGTLPYQVVRHPEMGKKSRSVPKKNVFLDQEWCVDRPTDFIEKVQAHLKPGVKMLEIFGSTIRDEVDALGPNIPGGFAPCYTSTSGITGSMNKCLRSLRKVQLQTLVSSLTKMGQVDERAAKVEEFKKVEDVWKLIKKSLADMKSNVLYDWGSDDAVLPCNWLRLAVLYYATKNVASFGELRKRKKKRVSSGGPRALHGIAAARYVKKELTDFLELPENTKISRTNVVRMLNNYIKVNKLQNPEKKVEIIPDEKLLKLLSPPEGFEITYFKLCSLLSPLFDVNQEEAEKADTSKENSKENVEVSENVETEAKKARVE